MPSKPLVSIIVNNFNYEKFLSQAIESALAQTYPHVEVIVVDDGSTDRSREIIQRYDVVPVFKTNGGQASALNAGFRVSQGTLVMFLDADDRLYPEAVAKTVNLYNDQCSLIRFDLNMLNDKDQTSLGSCCEMFLQGIMLSGDLRLSTLKGHGNWLPTSGNAFPRSVLDKLLPIPEEQWKICADAYLSALAPFYGKIVSIPQVLADYRLHDRNNWTTLKEATPKKIWQEKQNLIQILELLKDKIEAFDLKLESSPFFQYPSNLVKAKLNYLLLEGGQDLPAQDTLKRLTKEGISTIWRKESRSWMIKLKNTAWFLALRFSPHFLAKILAEKLHHRYASKSNHSL